MTQIVRLVAVDAAVLTDSNVAETVSAWNSGTTYAAAATAYRVIGGIHIEFVSSQAANTNHTPETDDGTWWKKTGPTNAWAMFDATISTQTSHADSIVVELTMPASERIDTVYLAGLDAVSVRIQMSDVSAGPVWDVTYSLADFGGISDWFAWLYEPVSFVDELLVTGLPYGAGATLTVTIAKTGGTAKCGALVAGFRKKLGNTRWDAKTEIRDYSRFIENEFGQREFVERDYRKLASCRAIIENRFKDAVERELAKARAKVCLYILNEDYTTLTILGTARFAVEMNMPPDHSDCSLQLESNV